MKFSQATSKIVGGSNGSRIHGNAKVLLAAEEITLNGWIDEKAAVFETLTGIHRAGADLIITYWAPDMARWLSE